MDPAPISKWSMAERKRRPTELYSHAKKLRSNLPRRKRVPAIPIVGIPLNCSYSVEDEADSSSSCINSEVSIAADLEFTGYPKRPRSSRGVLRRVESAGSFQRGLSNELRSRRVETGIGPGVCSLSNSLAGTQRSEPTVSEGNADVEIAFSGVSEISGAFPGENLATREDSSKTTTVPELSESSLFKPVVSNANAAVFLDPSMAENSGILIETKTAFRDEAGDLDLESDLACPEHLLDGKECSDYSACNEMTISELESDLFDEISEGDSSDVSLSDLIESPDEFSERSFDDSAPSIAFSLLQQLWEQFKQSSFHTEANVKFQTVNELSDEFISVRFPDRDDEESYQRFRSRERNEVSLHDYSEGYSASTEFGDLILGQRQLMVYWMLEQFQAMDLHHETLFLGVNLMDRFLSRGYFQTERNLQLLGIACLTLAKRIEENQPYNSIRQKSFKVGGNVLKRCEVVSMEWLVLEVLSFQCFLPTSYNFLWFYLKAARASAEVEDLCRYLAILTLLDHGSLCFWPSSVAAGLVILACLATDNDPDCDVVMETHVRSKADDLPECIKSFEWLVEYATSHR